MKTSERYDVMIIGGGLAGLALARQLLLNSDKRILLIDRRSQIPSPHQKVGESLVQLSAYYFSKVLDLEEHLLREHFMKYNLRFYWKTAGLDNRNFEDYSQSYIRKLSNIASYQLDRNKIEAEMLRLNLEYRNFTFCKPVSNLDVSLAEDDRPHSISFKIGESEMSVEADWVVDTSGRGKFLARQRGLLKENPIRHGASFFWVEGLVNIDKLTDSSPKGIRLKRERAAQGHLPIWLATNHFCGEGFWFWVIPLQGKTSLGLVYDNRIFPRERISSLPKLIEWVCEEFPLFKRDLPHRKILDHSSLKDFSYDCKQTISPSRWAIAGEAGRFTDPLYSPGGDLISLYNTLITDAILTRDSAELESKCRVYEQLMEGFYEAYVPTYAISYDALGDQEAFTLKYSWELAIYFSFYVFPFINDLFTDKRFIPAFLNRFLQLGPINKNLQSFISAFYQWKKTEREPLREKVLNDFTDVGHLSAAEKAFYSVGVSVDEARNVLDVQLAGLKEMARFILTHISAVVLSDERVLTNRAFIESIDLHLYRFDPDEICERYAACADAAELYEWSFDPFALVRFMTEPCSSSGSEISVGIGEGGLQWTTPLL